jgi:hypothetical protein
MRAHGDMVNSLYLLVGDFPQLLKGGGLRIADFGCGMCGFG